MSDPDAEIRGKLKEIAHTLRRLGEEQQQWERDEIRWEKGTPPFDDFYFYEAVYRISWNFSITRHPC